MKVIIELIALILIVLCLLCSCKSDIQSIKKDEKKNTKKVRALWVVRSDTNLEYYIVDSTIRLVDVDTLHRTGDIITLGAAKYRIIN